MVLHCWNYIKNQGRRPDQGEGGQAKRALDRDQDMGVGGISRTEKKKLLGEAGGFVSSKLSSHRVGRSYPAARNE